MSQWFYGHVRCSLSKCTKIDDLRNAKSKVLVPSNASRFWSIVAVFQDQHLILCNMKRFEMWNLGATATSENSISKPKKKARKPVNDGKYWFGCKHSNRACIINGTNALFIDEFSLRSFYCIPSWSGATRPYSVFSVNDQVSFTVHKDVSSLFSAVQFMYWWFSLGIWLLVLNTMLFSSLTISFFVPCLSSPHHEC